MLYSRSVGNRVDMGGQDCGENVLTFRHRLNRYYFFCFAVCRFYPQTKSGKHGKITIRRCVDRGIFDRPWPKRFLEPRQKVPHHRINDTIRSGLMVFH